MQTFLPYADFRESARVLDRRRLGKQRVEAMQIHRALIGRSGWSNHPAVLMWRGHEDALATYGMITCLEWITRGHQDSVSEYFNELVRFLPERTIVDLAMRPIRMPPWLGDERLHSSHRSALLHKDPAHYGQFGWTDEPRLAYYWPKSENTLAGWTKIILEER